MTLADRTPASSPFAVLSEVRPITVPKKSKAKPLREVMERAATRVNGYRSDCSKHDTDKTAKLKKAAI